jgi:trehalose 2-sulfotransferase
LSDPVTPVLVNPVLVNPVLVNPVLVNPGPAAQVQVQAAQVQAVQVQAVQVQAVPVLMEARVRVVLEMEAPAVPVVPALRQVVLVAPAVPVAEAPRSPSGTASSTAVRSSYLICATPRTGSYFLCDLLTATGVAGRPTEYLLPGYRRQRTQEWEISTYPEYHEHTLAAGTTANGIFGTKVHGGQMLLFLRLATGKPWLCYEERHPVVEEWFPNPTYIWIRRRDRVAQGISWVKASQSHVWWDSDVDPSPPIGTPDPESVRFDFDAIDRAIESLTHWDAEWRTFFDAAGIDPVIISYEDLLDDSRGCVDRVLAALGIGSSSDAVQVQGSAGGGADTGVAGFRRQADESSSTWGSRFRRLEAARFESTLTGLAGLHSGEVVYVCVGDDVSDRIPRDAVTISVDGARSPAPASFALLTTKSASAVPADVVVTIGRFALNRPVVIPVRAGTALGPNLLAVSAGASPIEIGRALADHLGAARIEVVGN